jgi:hypothetical protein
MARRSNHPSKSRSSNSTNRQDMNKPFQRRLNRIEQGIDKLPPRAYTNAENCEWAKARLAELMQEFNLSRAEAIGLAKQYAPLIAEWVIQEVR